MGGRLRKLALVGGFGALATGAWPLSFILLLWGLMGWRSGKGVKGEATPPRHRTKWWAGFLLALVAIAGSSVGGRFSLMILVAGSIILLSGKLTRLLFSQRLVPVGESVLLRGALLPFLWTTVAEVKLATRDAAGALSQIQEGSLLVGMPRGSVLLCKRALRLTRSGAEEVLWARLGSEAKTLLPSGGYVFPMDSSDAATALAGLRLANGSKRGWEQALASVPEGVVVFEPAEGSVRRLGVCVRQLEASSSPAVPSVGTVKAPPLTWEVVKVLERRVDWPPADDVTGLVARLGATRGEPFGTRLGRGSVVEEMVEAGPPFGGVVGLKRSQLRALAKIYG